MSDRRAAIRRERNNVKKVLKHKNSERGKMEMAYLQGTLDGRVYAISIIFGVLREKYRFGTKRLGRLLDVAKKESSKTDQIATQFNMGHYQKKIKKRIDGLGIKIYVNDKFEREYESRKIDSFVSACSITFLALYQEFGFSCRDNGKGRLDIVMELVINEFAKAQTNRKEYNLDYYVKKLEKETGVVIDTDR